MKNCLFCQTHKIKPNIIWESKGFFVKVGIGILAPGHVMIVPKMHISCFAELPQKLIKEFLLLKKDIYEKIKSNFSKPIIYEHGVYAQSIKHAHLHFVPCKGEYYDLKNIRKNIFISLSSGYVEDIFEIRKIFKKEGSYFYLEEDSRKWIFHTKGLPERKYTFRKEFVRLTGLHGLADWRSMPEEGKRRNAIWVNMTKEILSNYSLLKSQNQNL